MTAKPRVRSIEPIQLESKGEPGFPRYLLRDSAGLTEEQVIVSLPALCLIELADGSRSVAQILSDLESRTRFTATEEVVSSMLESLDQHYLLDNERARRRLAELSPRPVRHGTGYPTGRELEVFLDQLLGVDAPLSQDYKRASILPHIDYFRGHQAYRAGYQYLQGLRDREVTVVVLGISHAYCRTPYILTRKSFDTPLGLVATDTELVDKLCENLPFDPFLDEYNHMGEHSVELHALLLKRLIPQVKIVPVLCRSFHQAILARHSPLQLHGVQAFVDNLSQIRDSRPDVHFLASVDLAHMGVNFGGNPLHQEFLDELKERDLHSMEGVQSGDADRFFATHQEDRGERNYCGTPAIYTLLSLFPQEFELHSYVQCNEPDLSSTVTVASATLKTAQAPSP